MQRVDKSGFVTIELTATLFVLTVGVFGVIQIYHFGLDRMRAMNESAIAMQIVQNEIESMRALPFAALQSASREIKVGGEDSDVLMNATLHAEVVPSATIASLKEVTVTLTWTGDHARRSERTLTTLIAEKAP